MTEHDHDRGHCGLLLGLLLGAAALLTALYAATTLAAETPEAPAPVTWSDVTGWIDEDAQAYGLPAGYLRAIAWCEAAGDPYAVGRAGEVGPFQWHPFGLWWSTPAGRAGTSPWNLRENVRMAAWALARGYARHWSCA